MKKIKNIPATNMDITNLINKNLAEVPAEMKNEIDLAYNIAAKIDAILTSKGISQKKFAAMVGKKESEVSKWLTGTHNFTLKTIAKISAVLGEPIVEVTLQPIDDAEFFFSDIANLFDDDEVFYESLHTSGRVSYIPENHIYITSLNKNAVC